MQKRFIFAAIIAVIILVVTGVFLQAHRADRPDYMVKKLIQGKGDREALVMRLNMARGDTLGPILDALQNVDLTPATRCLFLDLIMKRHLRIPDDQVPPAIEQALKSPDASVRRTVTRNIATYGDEKLRLMLIDRVADPDPEVCLQACTVLSSGSEYEDNGAWSAMSAEDKDRLMSHCRTRLAATTDPELRYQLRSVMGRRIALLVADADNAFSSAKLAEAKTLIETARAIDPENKRIQIREVNHLLTMGDRDKAIAKADACGALMRIPQLTEAPIIDGDPTDTAWKNAYMHDSFYLTCTRWASKTAEGRTQVYIGHRDGMLYIAVLGYETDLQALVRERTARDSAIYQDDAVELLFDPGKSEKDIYQFVVNANGALYDSYCGKRAENVACDYSAGVFPDRGYWAVEFAVKGEDLKGGRIDKRALWGMNICRARIGPASEHACWWPTFGQAHNYPYYALATFDVPVAASPVARN